MAKLEVVDCVTVAKLKLIDDEEEDNDFFTVATNVLASLDVKTEIALVLMCVLDIQLDDCEAVRIVRVPEVPKKAAQLHSTVINTDPVAGELELPCAVAQREGAML